MQLCDRADPMTTSLEQQVLTEERDDMSTIALAVLLSTNMYARMPLGELVRLGFVARSLADT